MMLTTSPGWELRGDVIDGKETVLHCCRLDDWRTADATLALDAMTEGLRHLNDWESEEARLIAEAHALAPPGAKFYSERDECKHFAVMYRCGHADDVIVSHPRRLTALRALVAALRVLRGES